MCIASYMHSYYMLQPLRMIFHHESNRYVANYVPEKYMHGSVLAAWLKL